MSRVAAVRSCVIMAGFAALALGCSDTTAAERNGLSERQAQNDFVRATLSRAQYAPGDTVVISVRNISGRSLSYNFCPVLLEKRNGNDWETLSDPRQVCSFALHILGKRSSAELRFPLDGDLVDGVYRIGIRTPLPEHVELKGDGILRSATFGVQRLQLF